MPKLKVLIPLDGTDISLHSVDWLKKYFAPSEVEVTLINVMEVLYTREMFAVTELEGLQADSMKTLIIGEAALPGYLVNKINVLGFSSDEILKEAKTGNYDMIVMTKSSLSGVGRFVGSVTSKVMRNSPTAVVVIPN